MLSLFSYFKPLKLIDKHPEIESIFRVEQDKWVVRDSNPRPGD